MKIKAAKFYQPVQVGVKLETHLSTESIKDLEMDFHQGLLTIKREKTKTKLIVFPANIIYAIPLDEVEEVKPEIKKK